MYDCGVSGLVAGYYSNVIITNFSEGKLGFEQFNPLSPGVKLQILLLCFHTFLTEVVGRSC